MNKNLRQEETDIEVLEGDDKLVRLRLRQKDSQGNRTPYLLTDVEAIVFEVRPSLETDSAPTFDYTLAAAEIAVTDDGSGPTDEYSELTIQFAGSDIAAAGTYRYRVKVTKDEKGETVAFGKLIVREW